MADCESVVPELKGEENLIASLKLILRALESKENLTVTDDARKILIDLGNQLSTISTDSENKGEEISEIEERLNVVQETIMSWEEDQSMIWDDLAPDKASEYINAADEAQKLTKRLESLCLTKDEEKELLRRAQNVLQKGMTRLEEEFSHILIQNRQPCEPWCMSFRSSEEDVMDEGSLLSFGSGEYSPYRDSVSRASEEFNIDLIHPDVIPDLRSIASVMFNSNHIHECTRSYINIRKDALDEYLSNLQVENLNTDDVLRKEWVLLEFKIKRWGLAMKKFVRVYLTREKLHSEQIFGETGSVNLECFVEVSKDSMLRLLNFGEAISIAPYRPEKLFHILDIYEVLADLLPDLDALYTDEAGSSIRIGCRKVLKIIAGFAGAAFLEFKNSITLFTSNKPFEGGGIHPLTRQVMNYIKALTDHTETLKLIFRDHDGEGSISLSPETRPATEGDNANEDSSCSFSKLALLLQSVGSTLESNLYDQSKLYKDASLQHIFLMNNVHYIAWKFENSELRLIIGENWIRKYIQKFQHHARDYERATWSSILAFLKFDQSTITSSSVSRGNLKLKLRSFNVAFKKVYETQKAWVIPHVQLRNELRISVSVKVVHAYRTFLRRNSSYIEDSSVKYSADDIETHLFDLFEGSPIKK